jgi:hypothetical protein
VLICVHPRPVVFKIVSKKHKFTGLPCREHGEVDSGGIWRPPARTVYCANCATAKSKMVQSSMTLLKGALRGTFPSKKTNLTDAKMRRASEP